MSTLTREHFDQVIEKVGNRIDGVSQRVDEVGERIDGVSQRVDNLEVVMRQGFATHEARFEHIEKTLATLVESVDRFAKIYTDLNQEVVVMRQHLRDVEARVEKIELKLKAV